MLTPPPSLHLKRTICSLAGGYRKVRRAQLCVAKTRALSHLSRSVISCRLQGLVYMQKNTWIRAAVLPVAAAQIVAYITGVWVHVSGCFSFWGVQRGFGFF